MGERHARPSRAPVCGHDHPIQSLRMSDWLRAVRDVRPTRLAGWAAARARGRTGAHPTRTPQRRDRRLEAARGAAVGAALLPAMGAGAFRGAEALVCLGTLPGDVRSMRMQYPKEEQASDVDRWPPMVRATMPGASHVGTPPLYEASGSNSRIRVARMVMASARVPSLTALCSLGLLRGIGKHPLCDMCVFGIQHAHIVLPVLHMHFVPRLTQKRDDIVFLFIMKF